MTLILKYDKIKTLEGGIIMSNDRVKRYKLSQIFIGKVKQDIRFLYSMDDGERYEVIPEHHYKANSLNQHRHAKTLAFYNKEDVEIICSFQQMVEQEGVATLLLDTHHQYVDGIGRNKIQQIKQAIVNKKKIFASSLPKIYGLAQFTAEIVCDELGFNVMVHPQTNIIDVRKVNNVAISATKLEKFKNELAQYIYVSLLLEEPEHIFQDFHERSSCITSCLHFSGIKFTKELLTNVVSVSPELKTGTVQVRREFLKPEFVQETAEYQKVHILSTK